MKNLISRVSGGLLAGLAIALFLVGSGLYVSAQNIIPSRLFPTQQLAYTRFTVNFNSCAYVTLTCSFRVANLPYNAYVMRVNSQVTTAWNAGTSAAIALGTASGGGQLVASAVTGPGTGGGTASTVVAGAIGTAVTGNGIAQTGQNGGFDVWATILVVGALPTTGQTNYVMEWAQPNDGQCTQVGLGATAPGC
jgi:hypothetical protein